MFGRDKTWELSQALSFVLAVVDGYKFCTLRSPGGRFSRDEYQTFEGKDRDSIEQWMAGQQERGRKIEVLIHKVKRFLAYVKPTSMDFEGTRWVCYRFFERSPELIIEMFPPAPVVILTARGGIYALSGVERPWNMKQHGQVIAGNAAYMRGEAEVSDWVPVQFFGAEMSVAWDNANLHDHSAFHTPKEVAPEREARPSLSMYAPAAPRSAPAQVEQYQSMPAPAQAPQNRRLISTSFADIEEEEMNWLLRDTIPLGCLTLLGGLPDAGKSQITINLAATLSRGAAWPCGLGNAEQADVLILASEDGDARTIKPRLEAAGADMRRIHSMRTRFSIGENLDDLKELGESLPNLRLIVFDPISRYMSGKDANAVRDSVDSFNIWIEQRQIAAVGIRHPPKEAGGAPNVQNLFSGSAEEVRIARAAWFIVGGKAAGMPGRGYMLNAKGNILPDKRGFPYRIEGFTTRAGSVTSRIVWGNERVDQTAQEFLQDLKKGGGRISDDPKESNHSRETNSPAVERAKKFLREELRTGPKEVAFLREKATEDGIYPTPLYEAKKAMGLRESRVESGLNNGMVWDLPQN